MSDMPPQLISSALQGIVQQRQSQHARSTADRQQSDMGQSVVRAGEQHENQIENADGDSHVDAEGGGAAGGQGRAFSEHHQPGTEDLSQPAPDQPGIISGDDGQVHLDITA